MERLYPFTSPLGARKRSTSTRRNIPAARAALLSASSQPTTAFGKIQAFPEQDLGTLQWGILIIEKNDKNTALG